METVASFIEANDLNYRLTWRTIYKAYGERYNIWPDPWYKGRPNHSKLDFLEEYEELYSTLTKMHNLIKELK